MTKNQVLVGLCLLSVAFPACNDPQPSAAAAPTQAAKAEVTPQGTPSKTLESIGFFGGSIIANRDHSLLGPMTIRIEADPDAELFAPSLQTNPDAKPIQGELVFRMRGRDGTEQPVALQFEGGSFYPKTGKLLASFPVAGGLDNKVIGTISIKGKITGDSLQGTIKPAGSPMFGGLFSLKRNDQATSIAAPAAISTHFSGTADYGENNTVPMNMRINYLPKRPQEEFFDSLLSLRKASIKLISKNVDTSIDATVDETTGLINGFRPGSATLSELKLICNRLANGSWDCTYIVDGDDLFKGNFSAAAPAALLPSPGQKIPASTAPSISAVPILSAASAAPLLKPNTIFLTPDTLLDLMLQRNLAITTASINVNQAKTFLQINRGNLMPSINFTATIFNTGSPLFWPNSIQALIPFIIPTNWFNYFNAKRMYKYSKASGRLVELNQYASAYSLYATALNNLELRDITEKQYNDLNFLVGFYQQKYALFRTVSQSDVDQATLRLGTVRAQLEVANASCRSDNLTLKSLLDLPEDTDLILSPAVLPPSPWEDATHENALAEAFRVAPEWLQIPDLIAAANDAVYAQEFSMITTSNVSASSPPGTAMNEGTLNTTHGTLSLSIGFSTFPTIKQVKWTRALAYLQKKTVDARLQFIIDNTLDTIRSTKGEVANTISAEEAGNRVFETFKNNYQFGNETLKNALDQHIQMMDASAKRLNAELLLNLLRITLHRTLLTDRFAQISGSSIEQLVTLSNSKKK